MFTFYIFSFIPVLSFCLLLWIGIYRNKNFGKRPVYLIISLVLFGCTGIILLVKYIKNFDNLYAFALFGIVSNLYLMSFFLLEYSVHCQRIIKSFLMADFKQKLKSLYWMVFLLMLFPAASTILFFLKDGLIQKFARGIFKGESLYTVIHGILIFVFIIIFLLTNINIKNNIFNLQKGVIRKEDVLFNSLIIVGIISLPLFFWFNGLGFRDNVRFFGFRAKGFPFEVFLILNIIYSVRLYTEYFFRRINNSEKTIQRQNESMELKNYLINLVLISPLEEDINIIKSTIRDSLERSMRSLVVTEYRITGAFVLRRNGNILMVDSEELISGFCVPLMLLGGSNLRKKSNRQLNDLILKKSYDLVRIENTPLAELQDWGEQLIKEVISTGKESIVRSIPKDFLGLERFIGLFPVISSQRLDGIIVVFKESFEELFPEERSILEDLIDDLKIIFSITEGKRIQSEKNRLQNEMDAARALQTSIVPRQIEMRGYDAACYMETASEAGGDAYDYAPVKNGTYISIGDVSGHGLPAGLMALIQQAAFQSAVCTSEIAGRPLEPCEVFNVVNKVICEINTRRIGSDRFMTQNYLYEEQGAFKYAGAHEIALLYSHKEERVIELDGLARRTAFMGFSSAIDSRTSLGSFEMEDQDILLLYSDGIIEARDYYCKQYGIASLKHVIHTYHKLNAADLIDEIVRDVKRHAESGDMKMHGGRLADDITLLALKKQG